jgi:hypothetical protein
MNFNQTREEVLEDILAKPKPLCPHCSEAMSLWEVPMMNFSDGLGWGVPYLYVCFNDKCPLFIAGWDHIGSEYAHKASTRCLNYPGTDSFDCMPVFSSMGGTAQIIDEEIVAQQKALDQAIKDGFAELAECYTTANHARVLAMTLDALTPPRVRLKAAEMIGDMGVLESIEPLKNGKYPSDILRQRVEDSIALLHQKTFTRECPFCAEIIKQRAAVCKHCGRDVAGH